MPMLSTENFGDVIKIEPQVGEEANSDTTLKSLFVEAKKHAFSNNPQKAMAIFKEAFNRAGELKDNETQSRICLEIGKIYDDNDFVVQALNSYLSRRIREKVKYGKMIYYNPKEQSVEKETIFSLLQINMEWLNSYLTKRFDYSAFYKKVIEDIKKRITP